MSSHHLAYVAWTVEYEGMSVVVFATTECNAACIASEELDVAVKELQPVRFPSMDAYSPGPVPASALIHDFRWSVTCHACGELIPQTAQSRKNARFDGPNAYCCKECKQCDADMASALEPHLRRAWATVSTLCPDSSLSRWWLVDDELVLQFFIPGTLHVGTWRESKPGNLFVVPDDLELVKEYRTLSRRLH